MSTLKLAQPDPAADAVPEDPTPDVIDHKQITDIVGRLERRYPPGQISSIDLEKRVSSLYGQSGKARIRTFVAILVESLAGRAIDRLSSDHDGRGVTAQPQ